ncbi:MAG: DUF47 family protein [Pyrinomonadaceae bacterium MAG19_C2-C3]|nr:DUF47 family protein [Pyrinomonadaceae bacterium MAG19_C2-C3]
MGLFNFLPKEEKYFASFSQMTSYIYDATRALVAMLDDDSSRYVEHAKRIKDIEHACDNITHSIVTRLNTSFITPFDREDIYSLSGALDDILDLIDEVARVFVIYDIRQSTEYARRFADLLQRMAIQLHEVVMMLERPVNMNARLVELHRLENEGDDIYDAAVTELFRSTTDPLTVIKWKEIYETMETAVDRCESSANIIESIIIKNR